MQNVEHELIDIAEETPVTAEVLVSEEIDSLEEDEVEASETARLTVELEELKRRLREQQEATLEMARQAALEAYRANEQQRQLDEARAEAEKARLDAEKIRVQAAAAAQMAAVEVLRLESDYSKSKSRVRRYKPVDSIVKKVDEDYEAKVAELESEVETARVDKQRRRARVFKLVLQAVALVSMSAAIITITFAALSHQPADSQPNDDAAQTRPATQSQRVHGRAAQAMQKAFQHSSLSEDLDPDDTKPESPFFESVDRLGRAFDSFPDKQPAEIVAEINSRSPGAMACPMEWNHSGEPSFVLGGGLPVRLSILGVIDRCASLVEQYRMNTLAQERRKGT